MGVEAADHEAAAVEVDEQRRRARYVGAVDAHGNGTRRPGDLRVLHLCDGLGVSRLLQQRCEPLAHQSGRHLAQVGKRSRGESVEHGLGLGVERHEVLLCVVLEWQIRGSIPDRRDRGPGSGR